MITHLQNIDALVREIITLIDKKNVVGVMGEGIRGIDSIGLLNYDADVCKWFIIRFQ